MVTCRLPGCLRPNTSVQLGIVQTHPRRNCLLVQRHAEVGGSSGALGSLLCLARCPAGVEARLCRDARCTASRQPAFPMTRRRLAKWWWSAHSSASITCTLLTNGDLHGASHASHHAVSVCACVLRAPTGERKAKRKMKAARLPKKVDIDRSSDRRDETGTRRPTGFGFQTFKEHSWARPAVVGAWVEALYARISSGDDEQPSDQYVLLSRDPVVDHYPTYGLEKFPISVHTLVPICVCVQMTRRVCTSGLSH